MSEMKMNRLFCPFRPQIGDIVFHVRGGFLPVRGTKIHEDEEGLYVQEIDVELAKQEPAP